MRLFTAPQQLTKLPSMPTIITLVTGRRTILAIRCYCISVDGASSDIHLHSDSNNESLATGIIAWCDFISAMAEVDGEVLRLTIQVSAG